MRLQAYGIETDLPPGWEGRIKLRGRPRGRVEDRPAPPAPDRAPTTAPPAEAVPESGPRAEQFESEQFEQFEPDRFEPEQFDAEDDGYDPPVVDPDPPASTTEAPVPEERFGRLEVEDGTGPTGNPGEEPHPVVHLANFALPEDRGDFGSGAVDVMTADDILVVLFEYGPESAGTALFRQRGIPTSLTPAMFSSAALQRSRPDQAGCQLFFAVENRAFCCYTVLGRQANANRLLPGANATLAATRITPR